VSGPRPFPVWLRVAGGFAAVVAVTALLGQGGFIEIPATWLKMLNVAALLMALTFAVITPKYGATAKCWARNNDHV